jgi:spermidine synthase
LIKHVSNRLSPVVSSARIWRWAVFLSLLSGAAALGHQLLWTRRMIDLLGAGAESSSRVFGVFFLGLALGSAAAYVLVRRIRSPWLWLGGAELVIALLSLPIYFLPAWSGFIWPFLGPEALVSSLGGWIKLSLSVLLLLPPAFLMGWFLPILAAALLGGEWKLQQQGIRLYGWNTLGGVLGLALTAAVFLPLLGAPGSFAAVLGLNVLTAVGCFHLHRQGGGIAAARSVVQATGRSKARPAVPGGVLVLVFLSGFGVLALEVAFLEMIMLVAPLSFYAPAGILCSVILLLAVAGFVAGPLQRMAAVPELVTGSLAIAAVAAGIAPLVFFGLSVYAGGLPPGGIFSGFLVRLVLFSLLVCGPAFFLAGLVFPLLTAWSGMRENDAAGRGWGRLLAVNGFGGLCGAEAAYRWFLPEWGIYGTVWAVGALYAAGAFVAEYLLVAAPRQRVAARLMAIGGTAGLVLCLRPVQTLTTVNPFLRIEVIEEWSGREGTLAVVERNDFGRGLLVQNQYMLGTSSARHDQARQAHLPLLLHPGPANVAFIGLATGITPGAALLHRVAEEVVSIELSENVAAAARDYFGEYQNGLFSDDRSKVVIEDGRTYIAASRGRFDLVVGDLFLPWGPGEARLYSREHFEAVKGSLKPEGIFCQWLPLYQLTPADLEIILRTFQQVFPETHLFLNGFRAESSALAVVGFTGEGRLDWDAVEARAADERSSGLVRDPFLRHRAGVQLLYVGKVPVLVDGPWHTLNNMRIELQSGRERVTGDPTGKYITGGRWGNFLETWRAMDSKVAAGIAPEIVEAAAMLVEQELRVARDERTTVAFDRRLAEIMPLELLRDGVADREAWPGVVPAFMRMR